MASAAVRKFTPEEKPRWGNRSGRFGPVFAEGPALALTKTHVALQEKVVELEFLQGTFSRAQSAWAQEKSELENELRDQRADKAQLERDTQVLRSSAAEQAQLHKLAEEAWANEKLALQDMHSLEMNELRTNLEAVKSEARVLDSRNKQLRQELQTKLGNRGEVSESAAEAQVRGIREAAAAEIQLIWADRTSLFHQNADLQARVRQLQAELEELRRIQQAHLNHSAVLAGDKARLSNSLDASQRQNTDLKQSILRTRKSPAAATPGQTGGSRKATPKTSRQKGKRGTKPNC
mmetsp:Transcript_11482/g.32564  ORF Transcript_11482/g.32564 Transcript_11482/m.32564 type:complete len:292 (-) Transcript_11482:266-1141(-)|eukprot:CAMPEP_0117672478 /NCGR_PEP_ID=MMETSP0804-20121206/13927_1 /TAXON_ID=1074897 /ORGANISM="Tetraselmis astigmatica, Strain CCMP880" /LENGTH=291 /DNA_ID=CAMNT_0005481085 /DNA_START=231 /DNA_END=1106 /DNA_ORIENTATION=-